MSGAIDDSCSDERLSLDELATQRARRDAERIFAERGIPGTLEGELFHFGFAALVARIEVMKSSPTTAHLHMTLSAPDFAKPVLDCWAAFGANAAEAIENGVAQWADGAYRAYHDAFAHDDHPSYEIRHGSAHFLVFESDLQTLGADGLESVEAIGVTRTLLTSPAFPACSPLKAHRLRWVHGRNDVNEVMFDDESEPALVESLRALPWPESTPHLARHSAVLLPEPMARKRLKHNWSLEDAHDALKKASGLAEAGTEHVLLAALQHGIERDPTNERIPDLCLRWSRLEEARSRTSSLESPLDAPLSRGLLLAHAKMASGEALDALRWLGESLPRAAGLTATIERHVRSMAHLYCEYALPVRSEAVLNVVRRAFAQSIDPSGSMSIALSALEAPSAVLAAREALEPGKVEISCAIQQLPGEEDPRRARGPTAVTLWTYSSSRFFERMLGALGTEARPCVKPPDARIAARVAELAATRYSRAAWSDAAQGLVTKEAELDALLAVMVHPPRIPGLMAWDSRFHVMVAAALGIGTFVRPPFGASRAGDKLVGLLDGPVDWTTTAAAIALFDVALRSPECELDIVGALCARLKRTAPMWHECFLDHVSWLLLRLAATPDDIAGVVARYLVRQATG